MTAAAIPIPDLHDRFYKEVTEIGLKIPQRYETMISALDRIYAQKSASQRAIVLSGMSPVFDDSEMRDIALVGQAIAFLERAKESPDEIAAILRRQRNGKRS